MPVLKTAVTPEPEIDSKIRRLVDALNAFDGIATLGSCGGHPEPLKGGQWPEGSWYVTLAGVMFYPDALPPYLNTPGSMVKFALEGYQGTSADKLASFMNQQREACFILAARYAKKPTRASHGSIRSAGSRRKR